MLDQIALAEALGFGECWFAEHHFTDYSLLPSPNLMIASACSVPRACASATT
jgi:alkanesulfonate monooxygenase SsuD/methylene tetrahydromethanopterin reductase-like flavin-dependent oxidoreductase (luciferase family)